MKKDEFKRVLHELSDTTGLSEDDTITRMISYCIAVRTQSTNFKDTEALVLGYLDVFKEFFEPE